MSGPSLLNLVRWELAKLARRRSSYIGLALCVVFCGVVLLGFGWSRWRGLQRFGALLPVDPLELINGPFFATFVLVTGFFALMPLLAATVATSQLAGEARDGTLRALLVRPVGRVRLFAAKTIATFVWMQLMVLALLGLALLLGHLRYGGGDLLVFIWELRGDGPRVVPASTWAPMLGLATLGAGLSLSVIISLGLLLSAITDQPAGALVGCLGAYLISSVLQRLPDEVLAPELRQWLPTSRMSFWYEAFRLDHPALEPDLSRVAGDAIYCAVFSALCLLAGALWFRRRDLTA